MDNALLILILALTAWNTLIVITFPDTLAGADIFVLVISSVARFLFVGNFRLLSLHYTWNKAEVIITKIFIILSSSVYIGIGCFFMVTQAS